MTKPKHWGRMMSAERRRKSATDRDKIYTRNGARGRTRTGMELPPRDFKSLVSTNFTTRAEHFVELPHDAATPKEAALLLAYGVFNSHQGTPIISRFNTSDQSPNVVIRQFLQR